MLQNVQGLPLVQSYLVRVYGYSKFVFIFELLILLRDLKKIPTTNETYHKKAVIIFDQVNTTSSPFLYATFLTLTLFPNILHSISA